ncbi:tetratricopeptide repeat protein [Rhodoflexus sp.]
MSTFTLILTSWLLPFEGRSQQVFDSLLQVLKTREPKKDTLYTRTLFNIADVMLYNNTDTAIFFAKKGLELAKTQGWLRGQADLALLLGQGYDVQGKAPQAIEAILLSIQSFERLRDSLGMSDAYNAIGIVYGRNLRQPKVALSYYERSLAIAERLSKGKENTRTLYILTNIGIEQKRLGQWNAALQTQQRALQFAQKLGDTYSIGVIYHNIGSIYIAIEDVARALEYLNLSTQTAVNQSNPYLAAANNNALGKVKLMMGEWQQAIASADAAMAAGQQIGSMDYMREAAETLYKSYKALRQPEKALYYHEQLLSLKDSLINQENTRQVERLQAQVEIDKKQQEIVILEKENTNKRLQLFVLAAVAALFLVGGAILIWAYRSQQQANSLLQKQKAEIREKNKELNQANEELSSALEIVGQQKRDIQTINEELTSSIYYAQHIQRALLPSAQQLQRAFEEHFVFYRPRDIVSGDFYWVHQSDNTTVLAVADCTGHGVPGALLSMVGITLLQRIVVEKQIFRPDQILSELHTGIYQSLRHNAEAISQDGMDISIICIETVGNSHAVHFAGAMNPVYSIIGADFYELKPTKKSIGGSSEAIIFHNQSIQVGQPAMFYLFSDGFQDQFGGKKGKKFMVRRFRETLATLAEKPVAVQGEQLAAVFDDWKQSHPQVDDVLVVGVRL